MTPSERLLARLREAGLDLPDGARIVRTYAGRQQRNAGAWAWSVVRADGRHLDIGSQFPVTFLLRCDDLQIERNRSRFDKDTYVDPCPDCVRR